MMKFKFVNDIGSRTRSTCGGLFLLAQHEYLADRRQHQTELGKIFNADISGDGQHVILSLVDTRIGVWDLDQLK